MNIKQKKNSAIVTIAILAVVSRCFSEQIAHLSIPCYLRNVTDSSAMICWEWREPVNSLLVYGPSVDYSDSIRCKEDCFAYANLPNLSPGTRYYYNIVVDKKTVLPEPESHYFYTAPEDPRESFTFAVIGDTRTGDESFSSDHAAVIESIEKFSSPLFLLHLGDMVDITEKNSWENFFDIESDLLKQCPIFPVLGNSDGNSEDFIKRFQIQGDNPWYSFSYGSLYCINLYILDKKSDQFYKETIGPGSSQYAWLVKELKSEKRQKSSFTIASFFAPLFGEIDNHFLTQTLCPLFNDYQVDLVLNGGEHYFSYYQHEDVSYIISGGGGAALQRPKRSSSPKSQFTHSTFHNLRISVLYPVMIVDAIDNSGTLFFSHEVTAHSEREMPVQNAISRKTDGSGILLVMFGTPDCKECNTFKNEIFPLLEKKHQNNALVLNFINVDEDKHFSHYSALENQLGNKKHSFPVVKIGDMLVSGEDLTFGNLDSLLQLMISNKEVAKSTNWKAGNTKAVIIFVIIIILCISVILLIVKRRKKK